MQSLVLMRHAKAEPSHPNAIDHKRKLAERGPKDAELVGEYLKQANIVPDIILVSNATRCQETILAIKPSFEDIRSVVMQDLYLSTADEIFELASNTEKDCVMVIAHNPGLQELAERLITVPGDIQRQIIDAYPTGAALVLDKEGRQSWNPRLFVTPKMLRGPVSPEQI